MGRSRLSPRQALDGAAAIGALSEDAGVALTHGLKDNPLPICGPDGMPVLAAQRQPANGTRRVEVIDQYGGVIAIRTADDDTPSISRQAWIFVTCRRKAQPFRLTGA